LADPENLTLEANITSMAKRLPSCGHFCISKMAVSRQSAILDFIEPQIAPFDPPTLKTLD